MKALINKSSVFSLAWETAKSFNIEFRIALKYAWAMHRKYSPVVEIEFVKKSTGELTSRVATSMKEDRGAILFWSLVDNGWRKAISSNVVSMKPAFVTLGGYATAV